MESRYESLIRNGFCIGGETSCSPIGADFKPSTPSKKSYSLAVFPAWNYISACGRHASPHVRTHLVSGLPGKHPHHKNCAGAGATRPLRHVEGYRRDRKRRQGTSTSDTNVRASPFEYVILVRHPSRSLGQSKHRRTAQRKKQMWEAAFLMLTIVK